MPQHSHANAAHIDNIFLFSLIWVGSDDGGGDDEESGAHSDAAMMRASPLLSLLPPLLLPPLLLSSAYPCSTASSELIACAEALKAEE